MAKDIVSVYEKVTELGKEYRAVTQEMSEQQVMPKGFLTGFTFMSTMSYREFLNLNV